MKSAGKARSNGLYRHIRTSKEIIRNLLNDYNKYLKKHPLGQKIDTWLFQRNYDQLVAALESISGDKDFINKMNGISTVEVPKYRAKMLPEYDVFISHANADKEALIEEMYNSLNKLGVKIFYDKETLEWGDKFKDKILEGTKNQNLQLLLYQQISLVENGQKENYQNF